VGGSETPAGWQLSVSTPELHFARPGLGDRPCSGENHFLLLVCVHGNEQCGLRAVNRLIQDGFFCVAPSAEWPFPWDTLTVLLGNPRAVERHARFIDANLNRLFGAVAAQSMPLSPCICVCMCFIHPTAFSFSWAAFESSFWDSAAPPVQELYPYMRSGLRVGGRTDTQGVCMHAWIRLACMRQAVGLSGMW
jgi:Succinylglutamate desuccinylase / Aspartoacylase family